MTTLDPAEDDILFTPGDVGAPTALHTSLCPSCGRTSFPRRSLCPACGAASAASELSGPARLRVQTAVLAQPPGSLVTAPYDVGVAEFAEGICVIGLLAGPVEKGDEVIPVVHEPYDGGQIFAFRRSS